MTQHRRSSHSSLKDDLPRGLGTDVTTHFRDNKGLYIRNHRRGAPSVEDRYPGSISISIKLDETNDGATADALCSIKAQLDPPAILALNLGELGLSVSNWRRIFDSIPELEEISIRTEIDDFERFIVALANQHAINAQHTSPPRLPALSTVKLQSIDFNPRLQRDDFETELVLDALIKVFKRRPEPYRVREMHIQGCRNFRTSNYTRLCKAHVPGLKVIWDHREFLDFEKELFLQSLEETWR